MNYQNDIISDLNSMSTYRSISSIYRIPTNTYHIQEYIENSISIEQQTAIHERFKNK